MAKKKKISDYRMEKLTNELFTNVANVDWKDPATWEKLGEWRDNATPEQLAIVMEFFELQLCRESDDANAFCLFYKHVHGREIPRHGRKWAEKIYEARQQGKGLVVEGFRGSTKTTIVTITFTAWRIGKEPHRANLLVQVGDDIAKDNTGAITDIIANNQVFKEVFPHVAPDYEKGWGEGGYEVKRTDMPYEQWRALNSKRKDPTLVGLGYQSHAIIGKHPDGVLVVDDIHDENNTSSERELAATRKILTSNIYPGIVQGETWEIFIGTPWVEHDTLGYVKSLGEYLEEKTPVYTISETGEIVYTWPEKFGPEEVDALRKKSGAIEFARMYLLDLTAARNRVVRYSSYPNSEVRWNWPLYGGVDYASNRDAYKNAEGKGNYFAMAYVAKLPGSGCVVVGGELEHCTQAQAEALVVKAQNLYLSWQNSAVESVGKGDDFVQVLARNPGLRIVPMHSGTLKKERRLEIEMFPWLENGTVRISDAETPFLNELRRELDEYPLHKADDAMDTVYYALKLMPDVLQIASAEDGLPAPVARRHKKQQHPAYAFGRQ